jgi:enamine deaminase RidA (YjgF/YER057c/UK114 family)
MSGEQLFSKSLARARVCGVAVDLHTWVPLAPVEDAKVVRALYRAVAGELAARGGMPWHEKALGDLRLASLATQARREALAAASGTELPPHTFVEGRPCLGGGLAGLQVWSVEAGQGVRLEVVHEGGRAVGSLLVAPAGRALFLNALQGRGAPDATSAGRVAWYRSMFEGADALLAGQGFSFREVARTWLFLERLLEDYDDLNRARTGFFASRGLVSSGREVFLPASTGIQGRSPDGAPGVLDVLAVSTPAGSRPALAPIRSTRQDSAFNYGSAFSRGMHLGEGEGAPLLVSGTASIDRDGQSLHAGDVRGQILETYRDVAAVLEAGGARFASVATAIRYHKDPECWREHRQLAGAGHLPRFPAIDVYADVCRPELLFEMEAVALRPTD